MATVWFNLSRHVDGKTSILNGSSEVAEFSRIVPASVPFSVLGVLLIFFLNDFRVQLYRTEILENKSV